MSEVVNTSLTTGYNIPKLNCMSPVLDSERSFLFTSKQLLLLQCVAKADNHMENVLYRSY